MFLFPHWALLGLQDEYRFGLFPFLMNFISAYTGRGLIVSFSDMCQYTLFLSTPPPFPFPNPFPTFEDNLLPHKHFSFFHVTSHTHTRAHTNTHTNLPSLSGKLHSIICTKRPSSLQLSNHRYYRASPSLSYINASYKWTFMFCLFHQTMELTTQINTKTANII